MAAARQHGGSVSPASAAKRPVRACMPPAGAAGTVRLSGGAARRKAAAAVTATAAAAAAEEEEEMVACMWREVQGAEEWRGMVEPLHPVLRGEIVRYARLVAASYRALELDRRSERYLNCKHGRRQVLPAVGMADAGYAVTKYVYAAAPDFALPIGGGGGGGRRRRRKKKKSRWIGYVAVASDAEAGRLGRRDILVSFRGTVTCSEWLANFMSALSPARFDATDPRPDVRVESGFLSLYTSDDDDDTGSCRNQLLSEIGRLIAEHKHEDLSVTLAGHSMGSSLAILLGYDLAELGLNRRDVRGGGAAAVPVTVFSFGGPRVGNLEFKRRCHELGVKVLRVVNVRDPVTKMPGVLFNADGASAAADARGETTWISRSCYAHVGVEVALDFSFSNPGDLACVHDLQEAYIDQLAGCRSDAAVDVGEAVGGWVASSPPFVALSSWRWQAAAIRAGELLRAIGI